MATLEHCIYCFEALSASLKGQRSPLTLSKIQELSSRPAGSSPAPPALSPPLSLGAGGSTPASVSSGSLSLASGTTSATSLSSEDAVQESPLFITWDTLQASGEKRLRGCIGNFEPQALSEGIAKYALIAALEDTRFQPIPLSALPSLGVTVSLLTDFEDCASPLAWDLGTHGIRISFVHKGKRYGACYLPDVATEQGWDKEETLVSAMHKAGWRGRDQDWQTVSQLKVVRFKGAKMSLAYGEWREWRAKVGLKALSGE